MSLNSSYNEKCCRQICRENQKPQFIFNNFLFVNRAIYDKRWKSVVQQDGHILQYGACALHAG